MEALMIEDAYSDLCHRHWYEVEKVYARDYIKLKGSPRRYLSKHFAIRHKGRKINHSMAYKVYRLQETMKKLGIKDTGKEKNAGKR